MTTELKAIETKFKGRKFRSRLEARWAVVFEELGLDWEYEAQGFETPEGAYLPDFYIPSRKLFVEVKPKCDPPHQYLIYLAGKMEHSRDIFVGWNEVVGPTGQKHDSAGDDVVRRCFEQIDRSTMVIALIDRSDIYGTFAEVGYAKAKHKRIITIFAGETQELSGLYVTDCEHDGDPYQFPFWFIRDASDAFFAGDSFADGIKCVTVLTEPEQKKAAFLSIDGQNKSVILRGSPYQNEFHFEGFKNGRQWQVGNSLPWLFPDLTSRVVDALHRGGRASFEHGARP